MNCHGNINKIGRLILNQDIYKLLEVQRFDKQISNLEKSIDSLHTKSNKIAGVLLQKREMIEKMQSELKEMEKDRDVKKELLNDAVERLKKLDIKINEATSEKQLKAVNTEIDIAKTNETTLKEKIKSLDERIDVKSKETLSKQQKYEQLEKARNDYENEYLREKKEIDNKIDKINKEKTKLFDSINPTLLAKYNQINRWAKGTSVVPVKSGACYGCFMKITPQAIVMLEETEDVVYCSNCGRILYKEKDEES